MNGLPESVSIEPATGGADRTLVCGLNWVGDSVISLPALRAFRRARPGTGLDMLVRPALAELWRMAGVADGVLTVERGAAGTWRTVRRVRAAGYRRAYVLPNSFRSALIPFLARVPVRVGLPGHWREALLTDVRRPVRVAGREHQAYEYLDLLLPAAAATDGEAGLEPPVLPPPEAAAAAEADRLLGGQPGPWIGLLPGAARGPAKRWPVEHFEALARLLAGDPSLRLAVLGSAREADLCRRVAGAAGSRRALNLAGRTSLPVWAALLRRCRAVVANDSGGMHLAAAVGVPVVALFGLTDPARTGPLGPAVILQRSAVRQRDVPRASEAARLALASIAPEEVYDALRRLLEEEAGAAGAAGAPDGRGQA